MRSTSRRPTRSDRCRRKYCRADCRQQRFLQGTVRLVFPASARMTNSVPWTAAFRYGVLTSRARGRRLNDWKAPRVRSSRERLLLVRRDVDEIYGAVLVDAQHGLVDEHHRRTAEGACPDRIVRAERLIEVPRAATCRDAALLLRHRSSKVARRLSIPAQVPPPLAPG